MSGGGGLADGKTSGVCCLLCIVGEGVWLRGKCEHCAELFLTLPQPPPLSAASCNLLFHPIRPPLPLCCMFDTQMTASWSFALSAAPHLALQSGGITCVWSLFVLMILRNCIPTTPFVLLRSVGKKKPMLCQSVLRVFSVPNPWIPPPFTFLPRAPCVCVPSVATADAWCALRAPASWR